MTSRERVISSLDHKTPDMTPIDFGGHRSSGISAVAYAKLRDYLGLEQRPVRVYDMVQQLAIIDEDVMDLFGVDVVEMGRGFCVDDDDWKEWVLPDGTLCEIPYYINVEKRGDNWYLLNKDGVALGIEKRGMYYFDQTHFPMRSRDIATDEFDDLQEMIDQTIGAATPHPGAHLPMDDAGLAQMAAGAKMLRESTDRAIVGLFGGNMFELPQSLFGMENYMMYMGLYPDAVRRLSDKLYELHISNLEKWLGAVGPYIDIIMFGDDLGGQNGPLISPAMYREMIKPYHKLLWNRAKELADVKIMLHCCGGILEIIEDMIDDGLDAVNPVQTNCRGMEPMNLKKQFGDRLTFWGGGCDTRDILPNAAPADVAQHVKDRVSIMNSGGGFVFQQIHNIMADVPPENIVAMFKSVRRT
ncbi:MAG: methyltransferase [Candidatus Hydrogenedentes bacterium]|nr:methyltransferase [Candidatus Hydrogenedentota bacterium]